MSSNSFISLGRKKPISKLSRLKQSKAWLNQFEEADRHEVATWLDAIRYVSADEFRSRMLEKIKREADLLPSEAVVGLFVERELKFWKGEVQRAFNEKFSKSDCGTRRMRAYGLAPKIKLIQPSRTVGPEIGSEGIISALFTQLSRSDPNRFVQNPGPDVIRDRKILNIFLVTDFIGSGKRVYEFLDAFWRHPTVKSWNSLQYIGFKVIAFSGTEKGYDALLAHPLRPIISLISACPTVGSEYSPIDANRLKSLFIKYDPIDKNSHDSLGFDGQAAMMVFAHGCPNNAPRFLFKKGKNWTPLFPGRANIITDFSISSDFNDRRKRLARLGFKTIGNRFASESSGHASVDLLLVLAALKRNYKFRESISLATGLDTDRIDELVNQLIRFGWINSRQRLTNEGYRHLSLAKPFQLRSTATTSQIGDKLYYPKSLRPPKQN